MRYLPAVIKEMVEAIPNKGEPIVAALLNDLGYAIYRAPEVADWHGVARTLEAHLGGRESEEWVTAVLRIWRNETSSNEN